MLNRRFTPLGLLTVSINGMVGSAWLFAPLYAAKIAGPAAIIAWLIAGLATALVALTFAELAVMFPVAGGTAQIPQMSHGMLTSFIMTWVAWLSALTMAPIEVQAILQYASTYFTSLAHHDHGTHVLSGIGLVVATVLMLSFCVINLASFKGLVRFNAVLFVLKIAIILLAIVALMATSFHVENFANIGLSMGSADGWQAILSAVAIGGVAFAFTGFKHGVELAGEATNPSRTIPLAIVGSVLCCLLLYIGLQLAFIGAIAPNDLQQGWQSLHFVGDVGPFAGLASALGLFWLVRLLYIDAVLSPSGAGLIYVTSTARILYAMAEIGYVPKFFTRLNAQGFPVVAIMANFVIGMFLFLPFPGWQSMVSFLVSGMVISYAMGPIALICMRLSLPNQPRAFRLPSAYLICPCAFYFCNLLSYWTGWETIAKLAIAMVIGVLLFVIALVRGRIAIHAAGLKSACWVGPYLGGLVCISYLGAFGGKQVIPFGWDFLVIAVFSVIIMFLAVWNRATVSEPELSQEVAHEVPSYLS